MTAQISDPVTYQGKRYSMTVQEGKGLFDPDQHGLQLMQFSTGAMLGYYCAYEIDGDILYLVKVFTGLRGEQAEAARGGQGPEVYGVKPVYVEQEGCFVYELRQRMPYTGKMTLGAGFVWSTYVHMGFAMPWQYEEVWELTFEEGILKEAADISGTMKSMRANLDESGMPRLSGLMQALSAPPEEKDKGQ